MAKDIHLQISHLHHQVEFAELLETDFKYLIFPKGRRWGATHDMSCKIIKWMMEAEVQILWGDTINSNIDRYVERYFKPILKNLPPSQWKWHAQKKELTVCGSKCDFRSADKPENWEGFGYHIIFLNEAGIILKNRYLYENAVLPMLLDYPESKLIAAGTPKGQTHKGEPHLFYELAQDALNEEEGFVFYRQTTYDNTNLRPKDIEQLERRYDPVTAQQELYAEFVDKTGMLALYCFDKDIHVGQTKFNDTLPIHLSFDFNINPFVCLISQQWRDTKGKKHKHFLKEIYLKQNMITSKTYIETMCDMIKTQFGPTASYRITGDATQNKGEITQKFKVNAWTQIKKYLKVNSGNFKVPKSNPSVGKSLEQCNAMFSKPELIDITINPKGCPELVKDFEFVKLKEDGEIDKTNGKRSHLLDAFRYDLNTWDHDFFKNIK